MTAQLHAAWAGLSASSITWLTATLLAYLCAYALYRKASFNPLAHPVGLSVAILSALLICTGTSYKDYFDGARFIHFLLGPATVALAIPLYRQFRNLTQAWFALLAGTLLGSAAAIATAMAVASALGASTATVLSMATKSVTMPIAMAVSEKIGGLPSLTSALVMLTGMAGAATAQRILAVMNVTDERIVGFALGVSAHGIGTSRAFLISQEAGAFSALAMSLSGLLTGLILPYALQLWGFL